LKIYAKWITAGSYQKEMKADQISLMRD